MPSDRRARLGGDLVADRDEREGVPQARPSGAGLDDGPVEPWQPPSTLGATTKYRSVSIGAPGRPCRPTSRRSGGRAASPLHVASRR